MIDNSRFFEFLDKGDKLSELGKYEGAIECYGEALQIKYDSDEAWYKRGKVFARLNKFEDAIGCYDVALVINLPESHIKSICSTDAFTSNETTAPNPLINDFARS